VTVNDSAHPPANILIVDDVAANRVALRAVLASPDLRIVEAGSGTEALRHLLGEEFAVLLLDVVMPGMSGLELASLIKQRKATAATPILFVTAEASHVEGIFRGYQAGAVDYLVKPLVPEVVRAKVSVFVELHRQRKRIEEQARLLLDASRRESEIKLLELSLTTERRFRRLADALPHMVWTARPDGSIDYFNLRWFEYTGLSSRETTEGWYGALHPDDVGRCRAQWEATIRSGKGAEIECRLRRAFDGVYRSHLCRVLVERGPVGEVTGWLGTFTDIDAQSRERAVLAEFKGTLDAVRDAVVIFDASSWRVLYVSHGASEILGYSAQELAHLRPAELMPDFDRPEVQALLDTESGTTGTAVETRYRRKDGSDVPIEISLQRIRIDGGRIVSIGRDITDRKRAEAERCRLYDRALDAVRLRDEFLSIASHELKTPLTSLSLNIDSVLSLVGQPGALDEESATRNEKKLRIAARQVDRLARLIDDLLDVSRISAGRLRIEPQRVELSELVGEVVARFSEVAERSGSPLRVRAERPVEGHWDPVRLEQVVTNLLSNAIKFGAGRPIDVVVERVGGSARLTVSDQGIGIVPEARTRIFERFGRAVPVSNFGGLGLGLYIADQIVRAHAGTIAVASEPGAGATFTVELPPEPEANEGRLVGAQG
jgi:PAS domain S-box-containing protein